MKETEAVDLFANKLWKKVFGPYNNLDFDVLKDKLRTVYRLGYKEGVQYGLAEATDMSFQLLKEAIKIIESLPVQVNEAIEKKRNSNI